MEKILFNIKETSSVSPSQPPYILPPPHPAMGSNGGAFDLSNKLIQSILIVIIVIAAIIFFSGLFHLLVRFLLRPRNQDTDDSQNVTAVQGQLQQLFHLHDAGVDQSFIDSLPVFNYKSIIGLKNPFDCAVCLCEFEAEDKLRLLPKCSHAFHTGCIDVWLLSHSTCPLCRASLLSTNNTCSPGFLVLESGSESSREIVHDRDCNFERSSSVLTANSHLGSRRDVDQGSKNVDLMQKSGEVLRNKDESVLTAVVVDSGGKIVPVKLGKYRNVDNGEGCSSNGVDSRRCHSMGSFEYVMDENSALKVPIRSTPVKKKPSSPSTPGHRPSMSEFSSLEGKRESFSISKIWLRTKNEISTEDSSRRAASFRFPSRVAGEDDWKEKNGENDVENHGSSNIIMDSQAKTPSFARRTLNWIVGKQNKVVNSSLVTPEE